MAARPLRHAALLVLAGSALLLLGAYGFEYIGGLKPCVLCLYQRVPHALAIVAALAVLLVLPRYDLARALLGGAALVLAGGAALAFFHVGVEQGWWPGLSFCGGTGAGVPGSIEELEALSKGAKLVRCDRAAWSLLGISMAGYNALFSLALAFVAARGALKRAR